MQLRNAKTERFGAAGRVTLIGDHTDHTGGLALTMAIDLGTTVTVERRGTGEVRLSSDQEELPAVVPLDVDDPGALEPAWARYVAGVVAEFRPAGGITGTVRSTLPVGAGLSSSASLQLAVALALGVECDAASLARRCRQAEQRATGMACGPLDQLAIITATPGHAALLDCTTLTALPVPIPDAVAVVAVDSGERRALRGTPYADRRAACESAERTIGPLRQATLDDLARLPDPTERRRARHVVTENQRVRDVVLALGEGRFADAGALLGEGHASLRDDFEVSTPGVDALVARVASTPGVFGARMTGGGFGGVVVALCDATVDVAGALGGRVLRPSDGLARPGTDVAQA